MPLAGCNSATGSDWLAFFASAARIDKAVPPVAGVFCFSNCCLYSRYAVKLSALDRSMRVLYDLCLSCACAKRPMARTAIA